MPWVESSSPSFRARHDGARTSEALQLLNALEATRARLSEYFPRPVDGLTLVLHTTTASLLMARPHLAARWMTTAPAARRYMAGCCGASELHLLSAEALGGRASAVPGSRQMLALSAPALYARRVVLLNNRDLQSVLRPARPALALRWAWLIEGAAQWYAGQTAHARPAIARRLREGRSPSFPPSLRDAPLLGGTVIDLLVREEGQRAAAQLACRLHRGGPRAALAKAFGGRPLMHTEGAWRSHLARLAGAG
jgi:hypothetical protein